MTATASPQPQLPRSLVWAMTLQFAIGGAVFPFITLWFRDLGLDFTQTSYIFAASSALLLIFPFLWGMLADRWVPLNRVFILLNLLMCGLLAMLSWQYSFLGLLVPFILFCSCFNPAVTLLNPLSFHHLDNPRTQFGRLRAWGSVGWIIPSAVVYLWLVIHPGTNLVFTLYLGMGLAFLMMLIAMRLPHVPPGAIHVGPTHPPGLGYLASIKLLLRNRAYLTALIVYFLVASSFNIQAIYSSPALEDAGLAREWIGPSLCVGVVLEVILFRWQSKLLNRLSISGTIMVGVVAMVLRHLVFWLSDNLFLLIISHLLTGVVIVYHHIGMSILVNHLAGREVKSTAQTLLILLGSGVGPMLANGAVGWITAASGQNLRLVFAFAAGLALLGGILLAVQARKLNEAAH